MGIRYLGLFCHFLQPQGEQALNAVAARPSEDGHQRTRERGRVETGSRWARLGSVDGNLEFMGGASVAKGPAMLRYLLHIA